MTLGTAITNVIGDIALVIVISSVLGAAARRCGQPTVIGQILTGVLLGPSLLGRLPGHLTGHLFPHTVLPYLTVLAQVAVAIFMFSVGYEVDIAKLRGYGRTVPLVAAGALAVPLGLGMACVLLYHSGFAAVGQVHQGRSFLLFMGVVASTTAMPVMAAIIRERGLTNTLAGVTALAVAGCMDVVAWVLLAVVLISTGHSGPFPLPVTLLVTCCYMVFMLVVAPRVMTWLTSRSSSVLLNPVPVAFAFALASAWVTSSLGLQAVFGGFIAGLAMRAWHREPDADVIRSLDQAGGLLLPLFFIVTGLSLNIGGIGGTGLTLMALVFLAASVGKLVPSYGISRLCGIGRRESATIAALVNTGGLTMLIVLNVGLTDGIIGQKLFTILVLVTLATTVMTGPLLSAIRLSRKRESVAAPAL